MAASQPTGFSDPKWQSLEEEGGFLPVASLVSLPSSLEWEGDFEAQLPFRDENQTIGCEWQSWGQKELENQAPPIAAMRHPHCLLPADLLANGCNT